MTQPIFVFYCFLDGLAITEFDQSAYIEHYNNQTLVIPSSLDGVPVIYIAPRVFKQLSSFFRVVRLPVSLRHIGVGAFASCLSIETVFFGDEVVEIDKYAFAGCRSLSNVNLGSSVLTIGRKAFQDCAALEDVVLPQKLRSVGVSAFAASGLRRLDMTETKITAIERNLFSGCRTLEEVKLPENLREIRENAFLECVNLREIRIPQGVEQIGHGAFLECASLSVLDLPDGLEEIGEVAFAGCVGLKFAYVPASVKRIGKGAFAGIGGLLEIARDNPAYQSYADMLLTKRGDTLLSYPDGQLYRDIPEGVKTITSYAFYKLRKRPPVKYPESLVYIEPDAYPN